MIPSLQSTDSAVSTYSKSRPPILDSEWKVNYGRKELSGAGSEDSHRTADEDSPQVYGKTAPPALIDTTVLSETLQSRKFNDPGFPSVVQAASGHEIYHFVIKALDSSTAAPELATDYLQSVYVTTKIQQLFSLASFLDLEPGIANEFSEGLEQVVEQHGIKALDAIKRIILNEEIASSIAMETLKYIGNSDSNKWYNERRLMLEECLLRCRSVWARDGAGLGLSFLGDPKSIGVLERAIEQETSQALANDLSQVWRRLKKSP